MKNFKLISACLLASSAMTIPEIAIAQSNTVDDEIIVTATRRAESIQDIPIAVTAILPDDLEKQGVVNIQNLTSVAPSFSTSEAQTASGTVVLRIRGVGTTSNNIGFESAVGVFIDGAYQSRPGIALGEFVDVERVEVLRGPQGTLFGRNTSAGALNVINVRPNLDESEGFFNATYGNFDQKSLQGAVNIPLVEGKVAARVTGAYRKRDGFIDVLDGDGNDLGDSNDVDQYVIRGQIGFESDTGITGRVVVDRSESHAVCCAAVEILRASIETAGAFSAVGLGPRGGMSAPLVAVDPLDNDTAEDAVDNRIATASFLPNPSNDQTGIVAEVDFPISDFADLIYIGSYREFDAVENYDSDFSGLSVFDVAPSLTEINTLTQELRLQGDAFDDRLSWLVGAYYSDETIESQQNFELGDDFDTLVGALFGGAAGPAPLALFSGGQDSSQVFANNFFTQDSESWSVFTHNTFDVTDALSLTVGLRYSDESKTGAFTQPDVNSPVCPAIISNVALGSPAPGAAPAPPLGTALGNGLFGTGCFAFTTQADLPTVAFGIPTPQTFDDDFDDNELIYTGKIGYDFTPDISSYASFTHGFKSGGFNLDSTAAIPVGGVSDPSFESEEVDAYEIGVKSKFWDGRITFNVAAFYEDFSNFQVLEFTGAQFQTFNVAKAESKGVEIEAQAQPTDNLSLTGGLTVLDASYPDDCAGTDDPLRVQNLCGFDLTNAPNVVGLLGATYEGEFDAFSSALQFFLNGQLRYEDDRRTSTQGRLVPTTQAELGNTALNPLDVQESTVKINLRAGIGNEDMGWGLEAWATNITDEVTRGVTFNTVLRGTSRSAFVQQPRMYGVTARKSF
ncbi:TonB-dependent receptor [Hellea sp.]|nr:TonB-dependent receptor [Hellea sp.]